jgi:hypothetical protein
MPKKTRWQSLSSVSKGIITIVGLVASIVTILQVVGTVDFWHLMILPLYDFFTTSVSIYYVFLGIAAILILAYLLFRFRSRENILDYQYGRWIAELCQTPRTTEYLRRKYEEWSQGILGGPNFDYYMKRLEKEGHLKYRNEKWETSDEALDYIDKYHGG